MKVRRTEETRPVKVPVVAVYLDEEEARVLRAFVERVDLYGVSPHIPRPFISDLSRGLREAGY